MCDVVSAMMVIGTAASLAAQQSAADAQTDSNNRQVANTRVAQVDNSNQITLQRSQQADAASGKINANNTAMREAQSAAVASAGPSGLSVDALLGNLGNKGANYNDSVNSNLDRVNLALDNQQVNVNRNAASEINGLKTPQTPDYLGAALKIGSTAYGAYTKGQSGYTQTNGVDRLLNSNRGSGD